MSFQEEIAKQKREAKRPTWLTDLLIHVIAQNPHAEGVKMDTEWSAQHVESPRFRIGGMGWFRDVTGVNGDDLVAASADAAKLAKNCGWTDMPGISPTVARKVQGHWTSTGRPQYFTAIAGKPLSFVKAAQIILACELTLEKLLKQQGIESKPKRRAANADVKLPERLDEISSAQEIYQHMAIIPACWNLNDFNTPYLEKRIAGDSKFLDQLATYTGQTDHGVFAELASGFTVTYGLAEKVKAFCDSSKDLGQIRCRKGKGILGTKRAAELEEIPR